MSSGMKNYSKHENWDIVINPRTGNPVLTNMEPTRNQRALAPGDHKKGHQRTMRRVFLRNDPEPRIMVKYIPKKKQLTEAKDVYENIAIFWGQQLNNHILWDENGLNKL